jgi:hypothetical protein
MEAPSKHWKEESIFKVEGRAFKSSQKMMDPSVTSPILSNPLPNFGLMNFLHWGCYLLTKVAPTWVFQILPHISSVESVRDKWATSPLVFCFFFKISCQFFPLMPTTTNFFGGLNFLIIVFMQSSIKLTSKLGVLTS